MSAVGLAALFWLARPSPPHAHQAEEWIDHAYERSGRHIPVEDLALTTAAQALAEQALKSTAADTADAEQITQAVSIAGGADPTPRTLLFRGATPEQLLESLQARTDVASEPATHEGVGFALGEDRAALVVLLVDRRAQLSPFPRHLAAPGKAQLCGQLRDPLGHPQVFVTYPTGKVHKLEAGSQAHFCAQVPLPQEGRFTLELIGQASSGPEVVALFFTDVGNVTPDRLAGPAREPTSTAEGEGLIVGRINALREANGATPVQFDPGLSAVARAYSARMAQEHFFAHVAPDGTNLGDRLKASGYPYHQAGENLGLSLGPMAAHGAIERSPGHRENLLNPVFRTVGVGYATEQVNGRSQVILTEILADPINPSTHPLDEAYQGFAARRRALHLPPLRRSPILERLAREQAERALSLDQPKAQLPGTPLEERVFKALPEARRASTDLYVTQDLAHLPDSKSLRDVGNDQVGIGAIKGDSSRYGKGRYWVVVLFTGS